MKPAPPAIDCDLLDEEVWAAPDRLSPEDCFEQVGADWRWPSAPADPEDDR
jgi:hypothetical protein